MLPSCNIVYNHFGFMRNEQIIFQISISSCCTIRHSWNINIIENKTTLLYKFISSVVFLQIEIGNKINELKNKQCYIIHRDLLSHFYSNRAQVCDSAVIALKKIILQKSSNCSELWNRFEDVVRKVEGA